MVPANQQSSSAHTEETPAQSAKPQDSVGDQDVAAEASTTSPATPANQREPLLSRTDQRFVLVTVIILVACMGIHWIRLSGWGTKPVEITRASKLHHEFSVEINSGTWVEFMQLEGIGEILARRIVEDRQANGPFESVDQMTRVKGIGLKTLKKMKPHLRFEPSEE